MNKIVKCISLLFLFSLLPILTNAQAMGPGDPGGDPTGGGDGSLGGGAPIGSGLSILIGLGLAYGGRKTYKLLLEEKEELES